jgi:uncharacterized protein
MDSRFITAGPKNRVLVFLACLALFSGTGYYLAIAKGYGWSPLVLMWCPGLAAIVVSLVLRRRLSEIGWLPGPVKYLLAGWLLPIGAATVVYSIAWLTGIGSMPSPLFLERASLTLHLHNKPPAEIVLRAFAYISTMGLLNLGALGEEIGWRGFLVPELNRWLGFRRAAIASGAIWAVWHWPLVLWGGYNAGTPLLYGLVCLTAMTTSGGVWYAWLRLKSGSIWPCYLLHAAHNAIIQRFFDRVTIDTGHTKYFTTEFGAGLAILSCLVAVWFWIKSVEPVRPAMGQTVYGTGR